jgi:hypothetical protein
MESQKIKILLEKYWDGLTSRAEEALLTEQFASGVPKDARQYALLFEYKEQIKRSEPETFDLSFLQTDARKGRKEIQAGGRVLSLANSNGWKRWTAGVAVAVFLAVISISYQWPHTQTLEAQSRQMEDAYVETLAALQLVANTLNRGDESIQEIKVFDQTQKHIIHEN